jgi:hypothetical protein
MRYCLLADCDIVGNLSVNRADFSAVTRCQHDVATDLCSRLSVAGRISSGSRASVYSTTAPDEAGAFVPTGDR